MQEVELRSALRNGLQHRHVQGVCVAHLAVEPQRTRPSRFQLGARHAVAAGEQRHVMTEIDQGLGEPGDDPLGAAVEFGRHSFRQRRNLCDAHLRVTSLI